MMKLDIITPEKIIFQGEVEEVLVPTDSGQVGILPNHVKYLSHVTSGEVIIKKNNKNQYIAVTGGFLEVENNTITILADYAIESEDIQATKAQEAKDRAEKLLKEKVSAQDFAEIEAQLRKSLLELKVSERRKTRSRNPISQT